MKVLVACEESQRVCTEFRRLGHEAYSCDIQKCSGGHPEWHIQDNVLPVLQGGQFETMDRINHYVKKWDLVIANPPCTFLSNVTTRHLSLKRTPPEKVIDRMWSVAKAGVFFMQCYYANADKVAVENPVGFMSTLFRKPDCIIHPYFFATSQNDLENYHKKQTCFWLRGLPPLVRTIYLPEPKPIKYSKYGKPLNFEETVCGKNRSKVRSKTFPGIARAMAEQWGGSTKKTPAPAATGNGGMGKK